MLHDVLVEAHHVLFLLVLLLLRLLRLNEIAKKHILVVVALEDGTSLKRVVDDWLASLDLEVFLRALCLELSQVLLVAQTILLRLLSRRLGGSISSSGLFSNSLGLLLIRAPVVLASTTLLYFLSAASAAQMAIVFSLLRLGSA